MFSCEFSEIFLKSHSIEHLQTAAINNLKQIFRQYQNSQVEDWVGTVGSTGLNGGSSYKSSHQRCSMKKAVLRNFTKFTEKKRLWYRRFPVFTIFTEHLWTTASPLILTRKRYNSETKMKI